MRSLFVDFLTGPFPNTRSRLHSEISSLTSYAGTVTSRGPKSVTTATMRPSNVPMALINAKCAESTADYSLAY